MEPHFADDRVTLFHGDCVEVMASMEANSVDAICTDPPYELRFMNSKWDGTGVAFKVETWQAALRVLKPGGYMVAFGGTRTSHRMVCAIEDAGFIIQDSLVWLHGQGFPKGHSQLKPAHEPIVLARKGRAGALNIDGCRIEHGPGVDLSARQNQHANTAGMNGLGSSGFKPDHTQPLYAEGGRWPANVVLSHSTDCVETGTRQVRGGVSNSRTPDKNAVYGAQNGQPLRAGYADPDGYETVSAWECAEGCPVRLLDAQSGERGSGGKAARPTGYYTNPVDGGGYTGLRTQPTPQVTYQDQGGASRFFYTSKASRAERRGATHPTVKPVSLMRWLCRLVTPPGGVVLDCFAGSGTTRVAALAEGFRVVLIEKKAEYLEQLCGRAAQQGFDLEVAG
jgi:16S rRNA G966 N2-methylase RsmD